MFVFFEVHTHSGLSLWSLFTQIM